jgi:hypothetical protein
MFSDEQIPNQIETENVNVYKLPFGYYTNCYILAVAQNATHYTCKCGAVIPKNTVHQCDSCRLKKEVLKKEVDEFNEKFKVGNHVYYLTNKVKIHKAKIRKKAEVFFDLVSRESVAAVWLEHVAGYVECSNVTSVPVN